MTHVTVYGKRRLKKGRIDGAWELRDRKRSSWEACLTTDRERRGVVSFNIGNSIFFAGYLRLQGGYTALP
jgi:hypothetical protein